MKKLKNAPCATMFFVMETKEGYSLRVEEYEEEEIIKSGVFKNLTDNPRTMEQLIQFLWENGVYAAHVRDVLEDLGYAV